MFVNYYLMFFVKYFILQSKRAIPLGTALFLYSTLYNTRKTAASTMQAMPVTATNRTGFVCFSAFCIL